MKIQDISKSLDKCLKYYREMILTSNYIRHNEILSWGQYQSGISKGSYLSNYCNLVSERQYSFLMEDNSFFQFFYEWEEGTLKNAKVAFYPNPEVVSFTEAEAHFISENDDDYYIEGTEYILAEMDSKELTVTNTSHLRIDYDQEVTTHPKSHLQFGGINNIRLASETVITPFIFFDFISSSYYLTEYSKVKHMENYSRDLKKEQELVLGVLEDLHLDSTPILITTRS